jgi:hypothetical protein
MVPKKEKSVVRSSSEIPIPESRTEEIKVSSTKERERVIAPEKVNLEAFPRRLKSTYLYLF